MPKFRYHDIPALSDAWQVRERLTSAAGNRFAPSLNDQPLMVREGKSAVIATYATLEEARKAACDFVGRMQD